MDYQLLINEIQELITLFPKSINDHDKRLSVEYAQYCRNANSRLRNCAFYIDNGNPSEALRLADSSPHLLTICRLLQFEGLENWRLICQSEPDLEVPELLLNKTTEKLRNAYSESKNLEPLFERFRLYSLQRGPIDERLLILYQIALQNPTNPMWRKLIPLYEEACANEFDRVFRKVQQMPDVESKIPLLLADFKKIPWQNPPKSLYKKINGLNRSATLVNTNKQLRELANDIHMAYTEQDSEKLLELQKRYDEILQQNNIKESSIAQDIRDLMCPAFAWLKEEVKRKQLYVKYDNNLRRLEGLLQQKVTNTELRSAYNALSISAENTFQTIPVEIQQAYKRTTSNNDRQMERKNRLLVVSIITIAVLGIIFCVAYIRSTSYRRDSLLEAENIAALLDIFEASNSGTPSDSGIKPDKYDEDALEKAEKYTDKLKVDKKGLFISNPVKKQILRMEELRKKEDQRKTAFDAALKKITLALRDAQEKDDPSLLLYDSTLENAKSRIRTKNEFRQWISLSEESQKIKSRAKRFLETGFQENIVDYRAKFETIKNSKESKNDQINELLRLKKNLEDLKTANIAPALAEQKNVLLAAMERNLSELTKQQKNEDIKKEVMDALQAAVLVVNKPTEYRRQLEDIFNKHSEEESIHEIKKVLDELDLQQVFPGWNDFAEKNRGPWRDYLPEMKNAGSLLKDLENRKYSHIKIPECSEMTKFIEENKSLAARGGRPSITNMLTDYFKVYQNQKDLLLYYDSENKQYYYLSQKPSREKKATLLTFMTGPEESDSKNISDSITSINTIPAPQKTLANAISTIITKYRNINDKNLQDWETTVENLMRALLSDNNKMMDPIVKVIFLQKILNIISNDPVCKKAFASWSNILASHDTFDYEVNWYRPDSDSLARLRPEAEEILRSLLPLPDCLKILREEYRQVSSLLLGNYQCKGILYRRGSQWQILLQNPKDQISAPLYIIRGNDKSGEGRIIVLRQITENRVDVPPENSSDLLQGIPFYIKTKGMD